MVEGCRTVGRSTLRQFHLVYCDLHHMKICELGNRKQIIMRKLMTSTVGARNKRKKRKHPDIMFDPVICFFLRNSNCLNDSYSLYYCIFVSSLSYGKTSSLLCHKKVYQILPQLTECFVRKIEHIF